MDGECGETARERAHDALVDFVAARPELLRTLLEQHVADRNGDCRACPGPQSGRRRFPCAIRRAAEQAAPPGQHGHDRTVPRRLR